jgi:hypothetical protein
MRGRFVLPDLDILVDAAAEGAYPAVLWWA